MVAFGYDLAHPGRLSTAGRERTGCCTVRKQKMGQSVGKSDEKQRSEWGRANRV